MTEAATATVPVSTIGRGELRGWAGLAVASLALGGLAMLLLPVSRFPGVETVFPAVLGLFHKGLVLHVVFSFVVWFLAMLGVFATHSARRLCSGHPPFAWLGRAGLWLCGAASIALFAPAFGPGEASLNNYVPTILDPVYYVGLGLLALGTLLPVVRLFAAAAVRDRPLAPQDGAALAAGGIYVLSLVCVGLGWWIQRHDVALSPGFNEILFWGGGHVLQFANSILLLAAWAVLARQAYEAPLISDRVQRHATGMLVLFALLGPLIYFGFEPISHEQRQAFTDLQYGHAPSPLLVVIAGLAGMLAAGRVPWRALSFQALALSVLLLGVGGVFGFFVDGLDTRTPSHYHGMIGAVTLAYMGLFYAWLLPECGRTVRPRRALYLQVHFYAWGQLLQCIGLFLAGAAGTSRKTAGAEQNLDSLAATLGMALNGTGALIAAIGGVMFIWIALRAVMGQDRAGRPLESF